jgi:hypothetical protein
VNGWRHRLAHRLRWQLGDVVSATDRAGNVWLGFRCSTCGRLSSVEPGHEFFRTHRPPDEAFTGGRERGEHE